MGASYIFGHPRAQKLKGKAIIDEFLSCERIAEELTRFTLKVESSSPFARAISIAK